MGFFKKLKIEKEDTIFQQIYNFIQNPKNKNSLKRELLKDLKPQTVFIANNFLNYLIEYISKTNFSIPLNKETISNNLLNHLIELRRTETKAQSINPNRKEITSNIDEEFNLIKQKIEIYANSLTQIQEVIHNKKKIA